MNKFDGVQVFTSGLDSGHWVLVLQSSWTTLWNNLSVSILGLYADALSVVWFFQASEINSLIAKACASFKKCFDLGLSNSHGVTRALNYIFVSSSLVNAVIDGSMANVGDYFDTDHKAVSASVGLGGLLDVHLSSIRKQANKNCWKFDIKSADEAKWSEFKDATAANAVMFLDEFEAAKKFSDLDAMWDIVHKAMIFSVNGVFKKKWFKDYDRVFTKESSKLHKLEILVSKIVKTSHKADSSRFESLLRCWVSLDSDKASAVWDLVSSGANSDCVHSAFCGVRRSYCASKLAKFLRAEESGIRSAIERRMENFVVNKGHTIYSVLECPFHKVVLNHLVFDNSLILDLVEVKSKVDGIIESWTKKRAVLKSVPDLWQYQYLPLSYVDDNAFSGVMDAISLDDLMHVIRDLLDSKAAGLSGISNELWKHCDGSVLGLLLDLLNICLVCESIFHCWKEAWGVLTNTKLITLIETARKILSKLLSDRISLVYSLFNILCGDNFSSSIFAIGLVVKDALEKDCKFWLVLQDMRKVYNSVDWHHLYNSLDKVFSPLLWRIFYNPLLYKVKNQKNLCEYHIDTKFVAKTGRIENQGSLTSFLAAGTFVDDTIWVGSSQAATQYILDIASKFFRVNNISINNEKTVAIPINQRVSSASLSISGLLILIACKKESHQYLGIYLSSESLSKSSLAKAHLNVRFFVNLVLKKVISDKQFLYLVSAVLQPIVSYRTQFSFISRNVYLKWDTLIRRGLRLKTGFPKYFLNKTLYHSFLYSLKSFEQLQTKCKVASVLCFSNAGGVLGCLFIYRSLNLQVLGWSSIYPLCHPIRLRISLVNNFLANVVRIFLDFNMSLGNFAVSAFCFSGRTPISTVLGASLFYNISSFLKKFGITFAEQLYTKKSLIFNWKSFCHWKRLDSRGFVPHWFTLVCDFLDQSPISDDLCIVSLQTADVCSSDVVSRLGQCLFSANMGVINVYTNGSLKDLGSGEMKCGVTAYFLDLNLSISAKIGGLVSLTMAELQTITLALKCVLPNSSVVVYSDSQAALDVCVAESALVSLDFRNHCWMEWYVKKHSGVIDNKCANELASLAVSSSLELLVLVKEKFIKTSRVAVSENIRYFAHKIFRSINHAHWKVGPGFNVIDNSLLGDVNWFCTASVFISNSITSLHSYFLKALHHHLPVAVRKHLYSKVYPSVLCLHCGEMESFDHFFVCTFDSDAHKSILRSYLAKWYCVSELGLHSSHVLQVLSLCTSDDMLYTIMDKGFVFKDWVQEASSILDDVKVMGRFIVDFVHKLGAVHHTDIWVVRAKYRALIEKSGLIPLDGSVYSVTRSLSCMFSAGVIRLLGIAETVGVCFGFCKHCCFFLV
ncbi:hypothetical protein G9A89_013083 [Geosiphon pyriformis]|nr:hypothetical protein G9A89_013083 [Geosiphon pyriformis]